MPTLAETSRAENRNAKPSKAQALCKTIDGHIDRLANAVDAVRASAQFRAYLDVQARFHNYSWRNTMLICAQCPDATQVAGYRAWQQLGRQVRKGERAIGIIAPCPFKRPETDNATGKETERQGMYFKAVSVFDVAQTDGEPLPDVECPDIETAADGLLANLQTVATKRGIAVAFTKIDDGAYGVSKGGAIDIDPTHATGQQAKTLAHELAHEALHKDPKTRGQLTRSTAELEAEAVAYVVCRHHGLDSELRASRYIALWDGDGKGLRDSLERIGKTARGIIDDVDALTNRRAVA